jgi:hypothetical protein
MANRLWNLVARGGGLTRDADPEDLESPGLIADDATPRGVIETCCAAKAEAVILSFDDGTTCQGRFLDIGEDVFRFALKTELPPMLRAATQCSVNCRYGQRNRAFVATLLAVHHNEHSGYELVFKIPNEIAAGDPRMAFRIPILKPADLSLELFVGHEKIADARPLNLSLVGMLVETPHGDIPIEPGGELLVKLRHGEIQISLRAEIRRRFDCKLALFFPDVLSEGSLEPPDELRAITRELELLWLRQRAR